MNGINISKHLYSILSNDSELKQMIGNKLYPIIAEEQTTFPFIVFKRNSINVEYSKDGSSIDRINFSIAIAAKNYNQVIAIAVRCRELLENRKDDYFKLVHFASITEDYVDEAYITEIAFDAIV